MKEKGDNIRSRHSTFVSYPLSSCGGTPPILRETKEVQKKVQRKSSYPLPSYGGTPPIFELSPKSETINYLV